MTTKYRIMIDTPAGESQLCTGECDTTKFMRVITDLKGASEIDERWVDRFVEVSYIKLSIHDGRTSAGGSGCTRMWLSTLPTWLANNPGTMVVSIENR